MGKGSQASLNKFLFRFTKKNFAIMLLEMTSNKSIFIIFHVTPSSFFAYR